MMTTDKLNALAALLEQEQLRRLAEENLDCDCNKQNCKVRVVDGKKYVKIDVGTSGHLMVVRDTGEIFGIKAYGVIHRGHAYGTLDTIYDWDWSDYYPRRKAMAVYEERIYQRRKDGTL